MDTKAVLDSPTELGNAIVSTGIYTDPDRYHALFRHLRAQQPVCRMEPDGYEGFWAITRHNDIQQIELRSDVFINAPRSVLRSEEMNAKVRALTGGRPFMFRSVTTMDGADHNVYRKLTQAWFLPGKVKLLEERIRGIARHYVDRMIDTGGRCDFAADISRWYPLRVIMEILGVPEEDEPLMLLLTQQIFGPDDPDVKDSDFKGDLVQTVKSFFEYFRRLAAERRANPTDDVGSLIANATIDGAPVAELEMLSYYILIATAGHDTTSSTTAGGLLALLQNPEQFARLRKSPDLLPGAVDEMLRWVTPVTHFFRTATAEVTLRGQKISSGESLMMCYPSANRDEEVFDNPFKFDIGRTNKHVAFGYGPHVCLGQHLAKLEIRIFFEELLRRIERIELAGEPAWLATNFVGGLKRLPVTFAAA